MVVNVTIKCPNHEEGIMWLKNKEISAVQINNIARRLAEGGAIQLRSVIREEAKNPSGATAESIEYWQLSRTKTGAKYMVGSRTRGNVLYWFDQGRGEIYPNRIRAGMKGVFEGSRAALKFMWNGEYIFRYHSGPAPAHYVLVKSAMRAFEALPQILKEELNR